MANLTFRSVKGSPLTNAELDSNFEYFTGSHAITGSLTTTEGIVTSGSILISGSIIPNVAVGESTSSFSLGSPTAAWKDIYVSDGTLNFLDASGNIVSTVGAGNNQFTGDTFINGRLSQGNLVTASGNYAHAEGFFTSASNQSAHSEGEGTKASGTGSHAEGAFAVAFGNYSHAEGYYTTASGNNSHAEGSNTQATGVGSHTEGYYTLTTGNHSHAEGYYATASGEYSHAEGSFVWAQGNFSHAEGTGSQANGLGSHAEGFNTVAGTGFSGINANHAEGRQTTASGRYSHAEGYLSYTVGEASHAEGYNTFTNGSAPGSHAEGYSTRTDGAYAHSEGTGSMAWSNFSHAEGINTYTYDPTAQTVTTGQPALGSHAEGEETITIGRASHAEGYQSYASGSWSHAEGYQSYTEGIASHAEGLGTVAMADYQHVSGKYNAFSSNPNDLFIIGNGTSGINRKNILTVNTSSIIASGSILVSGSIIPNVAVGASTSSFSLGSPTAAWKDIYVSNGTINFLDGAGNTQGTLSSTANGIATSGDAYFNSVRVGQGPVFGLGNTVLGAGALIAATGSSNSNTAIGQQSLEYLTTGQNNTGVGIGSSQYVTTGVYNTSLGSGALSRNQTGNFNLSVGASSLFNARGGNNTALGTQAGFYTSGSSTGNVYIGYSAGPVSNTVENNQLYIHNSASANPLIKGNFSTGVVTINQVIKLTPIPLAQSSSIVPEDGMMAVFTNNGIAKLHLYTENQWKAVVLS